MKINTTVQNTNTNKEFAEVTISCRQPNLSTNLYFDYTTLKNISRQPSSILLDFLFISSIVYSVDKLIHRQTAVDKWTREIELNLPVSEIDRWNQVKANLEQCLCFLTGDIWNLQFSRLRTSLTRLHHQTTRLPDPMTANCVCLFSGGLDSLIGAVNWLESNNGQLLLVGHHDNKVHGPLSDQKRVLETVEGYYRDRIKTLLVGIGTDPSGKEKTYRSRSLLFLALGIFAAGSIGPEVPLIIPENGTIALNVPLTPSRRGSCSTRTAHPYFLESLRNALTQVGISNIITNPYQFLTKGECVQQCLNQDVLRETYTKSISCAKRSHKRTWVDPTASSCGRCMPCIYRRAALHTIGLDDETYGCDISHGHVDIDSAQEHVYDFRACLSFLRKNPSNAEIASLLLTNGHLDLNDLPEYSNVVFRAMNEIRQLLRDKAFDDIRLRAGIGE